MPSSIPLRAENELVRHKLKNPEHSLARVLRELVVCGAFPSPARYIGWLLRAATMGVCRNPCDLR
jgi:hypothetical protein